MRSIVLASLLFAALSASAAPAPFPRSDRGENNSHFLRGEWRTDLGAKIQAALSISGNQLSMRVGEPGDLEEATAKLVLDPTTQPKRFDFQVTDYRKRGKREPLPIASWKGIYRVEGQTLRLQFRPADEERRSEFSEEAWVLRRVRR